MRGLRHHHSRRATDRATGPHCPLGPDPARATQVFQGIVRPLLDRPLSVEGGPGLTYNDAVGAVITGLYDSKF